MTGPEIQQAILELSGKEHWELVEWFREFMSDQWDREIERDVAEGKLDKFIVQVDTDIAAGGFTPL